ncbi:hypothetical protein [Paenibacillus macerans]|uniref:hypothetical protein n=1 Tax=Paenibacillus macerans TaxID=44252 RepID=UPI003D310928
MRTAGAAGIAHPQRIVTEGRMLGDLIQLGVTPQAAAISVIRDQVVFAPLLEAVADIGADADAERIAPHRPDLILCGALDDARLYQLGQIAFTLSIDRAVTTNDRLKLVAAQVGRQWQAEEWIREHERSVRAMWRQIRTEHRLAETQTATCFILIERNLYVMASQGLPATVYHPDGFRPCEKVERMIRERVDFRRVQTDRLGEYAADRFFILVGRHPGSAGFAEELLQDGTLHKHASFVHVGEGIWNFDDAYTRHRLPGALPELLRTPTAAP